MQTQSMDLTEDLATSLDEALTSLFLGSVRGRSRVAGQVTIRAGIPISPSAMFVFDRLGTKAMRVTELAALIGASTPTITRQIQYLEAEGLIDRSADDRDGRATIIMLSDRGLRIAEEILAMRKASLQVLLADWSKKDLERLAPMLQRLAKDVARAREDETRPGILPRRPAAADDDSLPR